MIGAGLAKLSFSRFETSVGSVSIPFNDRVASFLSADFTLVVLPLCDSLITFS